VARRGTFTAFKQAYALGVAASGFLGRFTGVVYLCLTTSIHAIHVTSPIEYKLNVFAAALHILTSRVLAQLQEFLMARLTPIA
jgi:hypothetical protein